MLPEYETPPKAIILMSGGLDSSCLAAYLLKNKWELYPITFNYGSKHNQAEYEALLDVGEALTDLYEWYPVLKRVKLDFLNDLVDSDLLQSGGDIPHGHYAEPSMKSTVVPGRNAIMLSIAASYAESIEASCVVYANHAGDHFVYPDCRPEFVKAMNETIRASTDGKVSLFSPFQDLNKAQVCKIGHEAGAPLDLTWSCYKGVLPDHCGECSTCQERHWAFLKAGIPDPTVYRNDPLVHFTMKELEDLNIPIPKEWQGRG